VWRHDWLFAIGEELVRAVFWFHPAIWWLLGEIQLAREQAVDREVIDLTSKRDEYLDALLAIAGAAAVPDLAPAPLFLRKRHLKQRVVSILKEVRMSKTRLISAFAMSLIMLAGACWFVTGAFPLAAEPQMVSDAVGVSVTVNDPLIHRGGVMYPSAALQARIEGTVVVQLRLGSKGEVVDATVLSGPDELRKGVLTSVLDWHFTRDVANSTRQVSINFQLPKAETAPATVTAESNLQAARQPAAGGVVGGVPGGVSGGVPRGVMGGIVGSVPGGTSMTARQSFAPPIPGTVKAIATPGLGDQARRELLSRLPVHEGDTVTSDSFRQLSEAVREYDEHLTVGAFGNGNGETTLQINAPHQAMAIGMASAELPVPPGAIRVGGNVQQSKLTSQVRPAYPPMAKEARIQGVVHLFAVIGKDGGVKSLTVMSGHPLLVGAAMEAVRQWTYETTLLNGAPVEVATQIDVNFTLSQ
jgi:TonB family protein